MLLTLFVTFVQPFASIQWWLADQFFLPTSASPNIVIVAIDDESLAQYGRWSDWPRSLHAEAVENLKKARAMVVGFDIIFADASASDPELAETMTVAGNIVLPVVGTETLPWGGSEIVYKDFLYATPALAEAAAALGHANVAPDGDGVIRRLPLVVKSADGETYPALVLAMLHTFFLTPVPDEYEYQNGVLQLFDRGIPVDGKAQMRINFVDAPNSFTRLSYADVIDGSFDPEVVKHKLVLLGMTATGEPDAWVTPVSAEKMYGVEIYANAMDTILRERFLVDSSIQVTALMVLLMVGIAGTALPLMRLRWGALLTALLFIGYLVAAFLAFDRGHVLNILYPLMAVPLVFVTVIVCRVISEQSDKRHITDLFGRYVSPQVASEIIDMANRDRLNLGGVRREITVLFADIRGFTTLSEQHEPEAIVAMLNKYLSVIIERILANDGMINKFAGDSVMAVWNAPQDQPDHALLAVKAALECQDIMESMQSEETSHQVQFGIGINSGHAVAGNVGSEGRSEYTIIGDTVNLASRLCSSVPGSHIWIGVQVYEEVKDAVEVEELGPQHFKGKAEPVTAYRVLRLRR